MMMIQISKSLKIINYQYFGWNELLDSPEVTLIQLNIFIYVLEAEKKLKISKFINITYIAFELYELLKIKSTFTN
jgi:hypothetical protein